MGAVNIGFREGTKELFEEFNSGAAHLIPRSIVVTAGEFVTKGKKSSVLPRISHVPLIESGMVFREDSFDPTSRIRRGRFYKKGNSSHKEFCFEGGRSEPVRHFGSLGNEDIVTNITGKYVALGFGDHISNWDILVVEAISTGEFLFTLKSRSFLGILPDLDKSKMPESFKKAISDKVEKVVHDSFFATPSSIIELCRDAATSAVYAFNSQHNVEKGEDDLSNALKFFKAYCDKKDDELKDHFYNIFHCGKIIANLHNLNKSVKQFQNSEIRPMDEKDAELSIYCLGQMLKDFKWTY